MKNKKKFFITLILLTFFSVAIFSNKVLALNRFDSPAETVIGQTGFGEKYIGQNQGDFLFGLDSQYDLHVKNGKMVVADTYNHRILIYNSIPTSLNAKPDVVLGQTNFYNNAENQGNVNYLGGFVPSARGIATALGVFFDGTRLFVADYQNHRVLIYNNLPTSDNMAADVVVGQPDMESNSLNQGGSVGANTLYYPQRVFSDGNKLIISDSSNNRVLIYNSIPTSNNASADVVIGQADMIHNGANQGGTRGANTLSMPRGIYYDGNKLYITDSYNHRVLIFNSIPVSNNTSANIVIGQSDMTSGSLNRGGSVAPDTLRIPYALAKSDNKLLIADAGNNRILIFNSVPALNGASADLVIGQADLTSDAANRGSVTASQNSMSQPTGLAVSEGKIFINDLSNRRILIYNSIPSVNGENADLVVGQPDFVSNEPNRGIVGAGGLKSPTGTFFDTTSGKMLVADSNNNRILIYNSVPTVNNAPADVVIGQSNFVSNLINQGLGVGSNGLYTPKKAIIYNGKFFIADYSNNRVLIYNSIPTSNNASADVVIGQADMTHNGANQGGRTAGTLNGPMDVGIYEGKLLIADSGNNRILIYNSIPTSNGTLANVVIGQTAMNLGSANQGGSVGANTLSSPRGISFYNGKLVVSDTSNNRILIYDSIPSVNNTSATVVIGQNNMSQNGLNQSIGVSATTLRTPYGSCIHNGHLYIMDTGNSRVLFFNSFPTASGVSADGLIGQENFSLCNRNDAGSADATNLRSSQSVDCGDNKLFVSDTENHRILIYPLGPQGIGVTAPSSSDSRTVNVSLSSSDAKEMMISENADFSGASWETFSVGKQFLLSKVGGVKRIYVKMRDWANYEGEVLSRDITLDNVKPVITNNQSQVVSAGTREVELSISTSKNSTCKFGTENTDYNNLTNTFSITGGISHKSTVSVSDGTDYRYYVKCEDGVGNIESSEINFSVSKTEYIPTISLGNKVVNLSSNETAVLKNKTIGFKGTLSNSHLKLGKVELRKNGKFVKKVLINKRNQWRLSTRENLKERNITQEYQFVYYDSHNNIVETSNVYKILVDRKKPKIVSPGHQTLRVIPSQVITVNAVDDGGIESYQFVLRGVNYPKQESNTFTLPSNLPEGRSNLIVRVYDKAGNVGKRVVRMIYR